MKKLWLLAMMSLGLHAGKLQLPEPFEDPRSAWIETCNQVDRMRSMGGRDEISLDIRKKHVAQYVQDIEERLDRINQNRIEGTTCLKARDLERLWNLVEPYKNYPSNILAADVQQEDDEDILQPLRPGDDDAPSFSDGDDDRVVHPAHDQEDDFFGTLD